MDSDKWYLNVSEEDKSDIAEHQRDGHVIFIDLSFFDLTEGDEVLIHADFHVFCATCHQGLATWTRNNATDLNDFIGETLHG
jgi:hypothetical protein